MTIANQNLVMYVLSQVWSTFKFKYDSIKLNKFQYNYTFINFKIVNQEVNILIKMTCMYLKYYFSAKLCYFLKFECTGHL